MFFVLPLSLLAFGTPAVVGVPFNHTRRAAQATSVILNGETYVNKVSDPLDANRQNPYHHLGPRCIRAHPVRRGGMEWFVVM